MNIMACVFKRKEKSPWEDGILINEGELILDMQGKPVPAPIWNYNQLITQLNLHYPGGYADQMNGGRKHGVKKAR